MPDKYLLEKNDNEILQKQRGKEHKWKCVHYAIT